MVRLVIITEGFEGRSIELKNEKITIGRLEDNTFQIPEPSVSGHHCEIVKVGSEYIVRDLGSTNGTFIDDRQINEASIKPGQLLRLGRVELRLEDENTPPLQKQPPPPSRITTRRATVGIKVEDLEGKTRIIRPAFEKKDDKINKIFLIGFLVLGLLVIAVIIYAIYQISVTHLH